jgi:hypothetical protein
MDSAFERQRRIPAIGANGRRVYGSREHQMWPDVDRTMGDMMQRCTEKALAALAI